MYNEPTDFPMFEFVYPQSKIDEMLKEIYSFFQKEEEEKNSDHDCSMYEDGACNHWIHEGSNDETKDEDE